MLLLKIGPKLLYEHWTMVPSYLRFLHEYRNAYEVIVGDSEVNDNACFWLKIGRNYGLKDLLTLDIFTSFEK